MSTYVQNLLTGTVFEVLAEHDRFYWALPAGGGFPETMTKSTTKPYEARAGDVYTDDKGVAVIALGSTADGKAIVIPEGASVGDAVTARDPGSLTLKRPRGAPRPEQVEIALPIRDVDRPSPTG